MQKTTLSSGTPRGQSQATIGLERSLEDVYPLKSPALQTSLRYSPFETGMLGLVSFERRGRCSGFSWVFRGRHGGHAWHGGAGDVPRCRGPQKARSRDFTRDSTGFQPPSVIVINLLIVARGACYPLTASISSGGSLIHLSTNIRCLTRL